MSDDEIISDALARSQGCGYGRVEPGMDALFRLTRVAMLWRNEDCWLAGDPPRQTIEGYPGYGRGDAANI